jgi:dihydroorotate dehydrogenase
LGGVDSVDTAWSKMAAGADLLQLYTGMIYEGPGLPARILAGLAARLDREGIASIAEVVGSETDRWASLAT